MLYNFSCFNHSSCSKKLIPCLLEAINVPEPFQTKVDFVLMGGGDLDDIMRKVL